MRIGKKLVAATALISAIASGTMLTATPASADVGIRLSTGHGVGVYGYYYDIDNNHKVAADLVPWQHDGLDADCFSWGQDLGYGSIWYHTVAEYHNDAGWSQHIFGWTYAPFVDGGAAMARLPYCHY
ncbi:hypothetical protein [Kitasatospora sp. NPDC093806]|uniref:hypothetical protein n=1 Tax=Kitasatospora sp. NPDC093806 TaxID=3155075 RepID=UPI00344084C6